MITLKMLRRVISRSAWPARHFGFGSRSFATARSAQGSDDSPTTVTVSECGNFATLTLSNPKKHNCLSPAVMAGIQAATAELATQPKIRALFLKAEGKSFCAGGDLVHMRKTADFTAEENVQDAMNLSGVFESLYSFPRPVVAMVGGNSFGGGLGLISACDMAFGLEGLKFAFTEVKLGVIPATIGPYVIQKIGVTAARRYFLTAEQFDSQAAKEIGLLNEVATSLEDLDDIEAKLKTAFSQTSPNAAFETKNLITELSSRSVDLETRTWTARKLAEVRDSEDGREGMSAFKEKRTPNYVTK